MTVIGPAPDTIKIDPEQAKKNAKSRTRAWLKDVYQKELGREYDEAGAKHWIADIHDRGQTRGDVIANIRRHDEWKTYQEGKKDNGGDVSLPVMPYLPGPEIPEKPEKPIEKPRQPRRPKYDYTPDPDRKYNKYWDSIDSAAATGSQMTDDYYGRFLPQMRKEVLLGINEIGAADRYHGDRYEGTPPSYTDPKDLFDYYKGKTSDSDSDTTMSDLEKRIKELEDKYTIG